MQLKTNTVHPFQVSELTTEQSSLWLRQYHGNGQRNTCYLKENTSFQNHYVGCNIIFALHIFYLNQIDEISHSIRLTKIMQSEQRTVKRRLISHPNEIWTYNLLSVCWIKISRHVQSSQMKPDPHGDGSGCLGVLTGLLNLPPNGRG